VYSIGIKVLKETMPDKGETFTFNQEGETFLIPTLDSRKTRNQKPETRNKKP
jgi:hypothetical protein